MSTPHRGHHHVLFFFQKSLKELFWSSLLRQHGLALVDVFTFVYLYRLGSQIHFFPLSFLSSFQQGMLTIIADVLILRIVELCAIFPFVRLAGRIGLPKTAILGNFLMAVRYAFLAASSVQPLFIFIAALFQGLEISLFTPAYDTMFSIRASKNKVGRDVGAFTFILKFSHALLPVLAGGLIVTLGFSAAFLGAMSLLLLSNIPLLTIRWQRSLSVPDIAGFFRWLHTEVDHRITVAVVGRYAHDVAVELWPVYIILLFGKVERLGVLMSLAIGISLLLTYVSGWYVDHSKKNLPFISGGILLAGFWILRINSSILWWILLLETAQRLIESFFYPSFDAFLYRVSKKVDTFSFHVYREVLTALISVPIWVTLGVLLLFTERIWPVIFGMGALGVLMATLLYTSP